MSYGRGWFGRGRYWGMGRGWYGIGRGLTGRGRGNLYPFCRNFPWLSRRWWAMPYTSQYSITIPYNMGYGHPYYGSAYYMSPWPYSGYGITYPGFAMHPGADSTTIQETLIMSKGGDIYA